jgi:hypothetical protein
MTLLHAAFVWSSSYITIFLLGFQSRNATAGRYAACAVTSMMIGAFQVVGVRAAVEQPVVAALLFGTSGAAGICSAIYFNIHIRGLRPV